MEGTSHGILDRSPISKPTDARLLSQNAVDFTDPNAGRGGALEAGKPARLAQRSTRRTHGRDLVTKISHGFYQKGGEMTRDIGRAL